MILLGNKNTSRDRCRGLVGKNFYIIKAGINMYMTDTTAPQEVDPMASFKKPTNFKYMWPPEAGKTHCTYFVSDASMIESHCELRKHKHYERIHRVFNDQFKIEEVLEDSCAVGKSTTALKRVDVISDTNLQFIKVYTASHDFGECMNLLESYGFILGDDVKRSNFSPASSESEDIIGTIACTIDTMPTIVMLMKVCPKEQDVFDYVNPEHVQRLVTIL